jgi:hypothetical protein
MISDDVPSYANYFTRTIVIVRLFVQLKIEIRIMPKLNQDELGSEGKKLVLDIKKWQENSKSYPEQGLIQQRNNLFKRLNLLAESSVNDFKILLEADDLLEQRGKFFFDYMTYNPHNTALYISMCNPTDLVSYVETMCEGMEYLLAFNQANATKRLATIKTNTINLSELFLNDKIDIKEADTARFAIIKFLIKTYGDLKPSEQIDSDFFSTFIRSNVLALQDVNALDGLLQQIMWLQDQNQALAFELAYILLDKGLKITDTPGSKNQELAKSSFKNNNYEANYTLFLHAINLHPEISVEDLNDGLSKTYASRNLGAMRVYFEALLKRDQKPDKFRFVGIFEDNRCLRDTDLRCLVYYLQLCKASVYEMLEHISTDPEKLFKAVKKICYVSDYCMYEKGPVQGVFYYLANNSDLSSKFAEGLIPFYVNARYCLDARNNYFEDEKYIVGGHSIADLFIKQDPKLCLVTLQLKIIMCSLCSLL